MSELDDDPEAPPATLTGRLVAGRYQILGVLGQGGIGRVYTAQQIGLDRMVAVKVIRKERRADPVTVQRFMREARAAGRIASPHVVTLYDCGKDGEELYIAMELLEGQSLAARVKEGPPIELPEAVRIGAAIAKGLRAAHEAGVLHRDLKPANVFLCDDGVVKVLDFGIAKLVDDESEWEPLTAVNRILGTPVYMSPEAATRRPLGPTADLYALGLLLHEMVVGEPPFRTGNALKTLEAHVMQPAPPLREAAPWVAVPEALETLVSELLEKDPSARPRDAGEVAERLDRIATRLAIGAIPAREERTAIDISAPRTEASDTYSLDTNDETEVWSGRPWEGPDGAPVPGMPAPVMPAAPTPAPPGPSTPERERPTFVPAPHGAPTAEDAATVPHTTRPSRLPRLEGKHLVIAALAAGVLAFLLMLLIRLALG